VNADPAQGAIKAVGKIAGKTVAEDTYLPTAVPAKFALREYKTTLGPGDGPNVAQIELSLVDASGNLARDAADGVDVALAGNARLLGIESGDADSHENYQAPHHNAFHGRLLILVETHGPVTVTATAGGLPAASIKVGG
jgi:beta-galactosidase